MGRRRPSWVVLCVVVGATLLGLVLSLLRARSGTIDLWFDDAWVAIATRTSVGNATSINGAPGFTLVARWWMGLSPDSVSWSQSLALLGFLCIPAAIYWAALRTCRSRWPAAAVACLAALAPVLVTESARLKQYTWECAISAVMVGLTASAVQKAPSLRRVIASAAVVCLGVLFSGALVMPAAVLVGVLLLREVRGSHFGATGERAIRALVLGATTVFVGLWVFIVLGRVSPAYNNVWRSYGAFLGSSREIGPTFRQLLAQGRGFLGGFLPGGSTAFAPSALLMLLMLGVGTYVILRWRAVWWLVLAVGVALVASGAEKYPLGPVGYARVDSWLFPWLAVLFAQMLTDAWQYVSRRFDTERTRRALVPLAVVAFCGLVVGSWVSVSTYPPTRARDAAATLLSPASRGARYVEQQDMPVLLVIPGSGRLVKTDVATASNSTIFHPAHGIRVLDLRAGRHRSAIAQLARDCGTEVTIVGATPSILAPVTRALPCSVMRQDWDRRGTETHWDDVMTLRLQPMRGSGSG